MKFEIRVFDKEGNELKLENKIFCGLPFESEKAIQKFIKAIKSELPSGFYYKIIKHQNNIGKGESD